MAEKEQRQQAIDKAKQLVDQGGWLSRNDAPRLPLVERLHRTQRERDAALSRATQAEQRVGTFETDRALVLQAFTAITESDSTTEMRELAQRALDVLRAEPMSL